MSINHSMKEFYSR